MKFLVLLRYTYLRLRGFSPDECVVYSIMVCSREYKKQGIDYHGCCERMMKIISKNGEQPYMRDAVKKTSSIAYRGIYLTNRDIIRRIESQR
jgi:hypothetical protein